MKKVSHITAEMAEEMLHDLLQGAATAVIKIVIGLVILLVGFKLIKFITKKIKKGKGFAKLDVGMQKFLYSALKIILKVLVIIGVAGYWGFPISTLVTAMGSVFIAIGLALQGSLSNVSGGVILLFFKPFQVGDYIIVSDQQGGTVKEIGLFYTTLITPDNRKVVVPNAEISNEQLINVTSEPTRRVDLEFSVAYGTDTDRVKEIMLACAEQCELKLQEPAPQALVTRYGDSSISVVLRLWCSTPDYWDVYNPLLEQIKRELDKEQIEIPFPQLQVHLKN